MKLNEVEPMAGGNENETTNKTDQKQHENQETLELKVAVVSGLIELEKCWEERTTAFESKLKVRKVVTPAGGES